MVSGVVKKYPLSCCIPTLNEEKNIARCIKSVIEWVDEVIVLDCESTDKTCEIAKSLGAQVKTRKWDNTANQFSFLFSLAKNEWVLHLDADEVCSEELKSKIEEIFDSGEIESNDAYLINVKSFFANKWIKCWSYSNFGVRLFRKNKITLSCKGFHHRITVDGKVAKFPIDVGILHYGVSNFDHYFTKLKRETYEIAKWRYERKEKFSILKLILKANFNFFKSYILKKGFLDGKEGFIVSILSAIYIIFQYLILWEYEESGKNIGGIEGKQEKVR